MEERVSLIKFCFNGKFIFVKTEWQPNKNDLFHIRLYDGDRSWSGHFSCEFAKKYRERVEESEEQYNKNVKRGLSNDKDFTYDFKLQTDDENSAIFSWKKKFVDSTHGHAVMVHGSVPVHCDKIPESKDCLIDLLISENHHLLDTIERINIQNTELSLDLEKCRNDLDKFVDMKTNLEASLYDKFIQLLTAKKKRIQVLEEYIGDKTQFDKFKSSKSEAMDEVD